MSGNIKNIFISHIHEDDDELARLKGLLASKGCTVRDYSINSSNPNNAKNPDYIMRGLLKPRIDRAGTMVVLISPGTKDSEWVKKEIEYAHKKGKRIVGVWAHGAKDCDLPENLDNYADAIVGWRGDNIIDAINGKDNWETASGQPQPLRSIKRYGC